jgi:hypothetical protein
MWDYVRLCPNEALEFVAHRINRAVRQLLILAFRNPVLLLYVQIDTDAMYFGSADSFPHFGLL